MSVRQSDLDKETNDSHNNCYQNAIRYKEEENAFIKKHVNMVYFLLSFYKTKVVQKIKFGPCAKHRST